MRTETRQAVTPRHDVNTPGALVMPRPNATHQVTAVQTAEFAVIKSLRSKRQLHHLRRRTRNFSINSPNYRKVQ